MATYTFSTLFNLAAGTIVINDTTNYPGQGLVASASHVKIAVSLAASTGNITVYNPPAGNNYDIQPSVSTANIHTITMPKDATGKFLEGQYSVTVLYYQTLAPGVDALVTYIPVIYNFTNPCVTMDLQSTIDCGASTIVSTDATVYGSNVSSITRVHKVYAPPILGLSPFVNALASLTVTGIYTTTWTQSVVSSVVYLNADGSHTSITFTGIREFGVVCDDDMCKILCCLTNLKNTYDRLACKNPTAALQMKEEKIDRILTDALFYKLARDCGNSTKAALYLQQVLDDSGCTDDCTGCAGSGTPVYITPTAASVSNSYNVISPDNSISVVTAPTGGTTTTFYISVSPQLQTLINNFYNVTVSTSTPAYITIVPSGTNPKNYAVNFTGTLPTVIDQVHVLLRLQLLTVSTMQVVVAEIGTRTAKFKDPSLSWTYLIGTANNTNDPAILTISSFLSVNTRYIVHSQLMRVKQVFNPMAASILQVETAWFDDTLDSFVLRFINTATATPLSYKDVWVATQNQPIYIALSLY